jgi:hypothetical protein
MVGVLYIVFSGTQDRSPIDDFRLDVPAVLAQIGCFIQ